ncbi:type II toxin-antitoxin system RelE/ParE family toxin [Falsiroseomonas ponticola]|uniref:type II toxin-antitoxin system RelE/ParE family toxin n=1 Tax=Falsiroseomonas ponticola TaxID=2786951 RepID=UPI0019341342|nr:type II toxin-antitoxin system RelE/ParE family toxin [Roseomonas ponticola]
MTHRVVFAPEALDDLRDLYDVIADASLPERALGYVEALRRHCLGLAEFPERGTRRDAIRPGLRTLGYRRRVTIAFQVTGSTVTILRLLYAGRDLEGWAGQDEAD